MTIRLGSRVFATHSLGCWYVRARAYVSLGGGRDERQQLRRVVSDSLGPAFGVILPRETGIVCGRNEGYKVLRVSFGTLTGLPVIASWL